MGLEKIDKKIGVPGVDYFSSPLRGLAVIHYQNVSLFFQSLIPYFSPN